MLLLTATLSACQPEKPEPPEPPAGGGCGNGTVESGEVCDGNCPTSCNDGRACTRDVLTGSAGSCDAVCTHAPVTACAGGDGCCAPGCNTDSDCSPTCGNGVVERGESCDGNCPTRCDDNIACTRDVPTGSASNCDAACTHQPVTVCTGGDGCCASGCDANTDSDCSTTCGNGVVEPGEACDGDCPTGCDDGDACTADVLAGSPRMCSAVCGHPSITTCTGGDGCCAPGCNANTDSDCSPSCGNDIVEPGETCDGDCPTRCDDGNACTTDELTGSASTCTAACTPQPVTACTGGDGCCAPGCNANTDSDCSPTCGNGVVEQGETCDGDCPTHCGDGQACTTDVMEGSANTCDVTCANEPITVCRNGDGCCASGCNGNNDNNCPSVCGNTLIEPGETCDGDCPTRCDDGDVCTTDALTGSASTCTAACTAQPVTACTSGDGCCPRGCRRAADADCPEPLRVNGEVGTTTWSGEVIVTGTVTVTPGSTLTIASGTHVSFDFVDADADGKGDVALVVEGTLIAQGDATYPVVMTASSGTWPGSWKGVLLRGPGSTVQGVTVRYAQTGVLVEVGTHTLPRLEVLSSSGPGVQVKAGAAAALSDCTLRDNGGAGAFSEDARLDLTHCELKGNETGAYYRGTATGLLTRGDVLDNRGEGLSLWRSATGGEPSLVISYSNFINNSTQHTGRYARRALDISTSREWACSCYKSGQWTAPAGATAHTLYVSYGESQYFNTSISGDVWANDVNVLHMEADSSGYVDVSARAATRIGAGIWDQQADYTGSSAILGVDILYYGDATLGDTQVVAALSRRGIDARYNYWNGAFYLVDLAALFAMPANDPYGADPSVRTVNYDNALYSRVTNAGPR